MEVVLKLAQMLHILVPVDIKWWHKVLPDPFRCEKTENTQRRRIPSAVQAVL